MEIVEQIWDSDSINRVIMRISHQILERGSDLSNIGIIGMQSRGVFIARKIRDNIKNITGVELPFGVLDNTFYRDDYTSNSLEPKLTDVPFDVTDRRIILVDDVLYTGRTVKSALDALFDLGRPKSVELVVLVDRGHRELPIRSDYIGKKMTTQSNQMVKLKVSEIDGEDSLWLVEKECD